MSVFKGGELQHMYSIARNFYVCNKSYLSGGVPRRNSNSEIFVLPSELLFEQPQGFCRMSCKTLDNWREQVTERRRRRKRFDDFHGKFVSLKRQSILDAAAGLNASIAAVM